MKTARDTTDEPPGGAPRVLSYSQNAIPTDVTSATRLVETRKKSEGHWSDPGYVFLSPRGKQWDETNFSRGYRRLRQRFGQSLGQRFGQVVVGL